MCERSKPTFISFTFISFTVANLIRDTFCICNAVTKDYLRLHYQHVIYVNTGRIKHGERSMFSVNKSVYIWLCSNFWTGLRVTSTRHVLLYLWKYMWPIFRTLMTHFGKSINHGDSYVYFLLSVLEIKKKACHVPKKSRKVEQITGLCWGWLLCVELFLSVSSGVSWSLKLCAVHKVYDK